MSVRVLPERLAPPLRSPSVSAAPAARARPVAVADFASVLGSLGREVQRGESLMRDQRGAGREGREVAPGEPIALQAGVFRYGEAIELASPLIDHVTSSVKTVLDGRRRIGPELRGHSTLLQLSGDRVDGSRVQAASP
jgi:hypothetical protein